PDSPRWAGLEARVRAIGAVNHPAVRTVLALDTDPPGVALEGDSFPPLAELIEQGSVDLARALKILGELCRALAAAHHVGIFHGRGRRAAAVDARPGASAVRGGAGPDESADAAGARRAAAAETRGRCHRGAIRARPPARCRCDGRSLGGARFHRRPERRREATA